MVSIVARYGLDSPGMESWWGKIFHTHPDCPWGPLSFLYNASTPHLGIHGLLSVYFTFVNLPVNQYLQISQLEIKQLLLYP